jgi:hypothetical protein
MNERLKGEVLKLEPSTQEGFIVFGVNVDANHNALVTDVNGEYIASKVVGQFLAFSGQANGEQGQ